MNHIALYSTVTVFSGIIFESQEAECCEHLAKAREVGSPFPLPAARALRHAGKLVGLSKTESFMGEQSRGCPLTHHLAITQSLHILYRLRLRANTQRASNSGHCTVPLPARHECLLSAVEPCGTRGSQQTLSAQTLLDRNLAPNELLFMPRPFIYWTLSICTVRRHQDGDNQS